MNDNKPARLNDYHMDLPTTVRMRWSEVKFFEF